MVSRDTTKDSSPLFLCDTVRKKRMGDWESFIFPLVMFAFLIAFARAVFFVVKSLVMSKSSAQIDKKLDRIIELFEKQSKG